MLRYIRSLDWIPILAFGLVTVCTLWLISSHYPYVGQAAEYQPSQEAIGEEPWWEFAEAWIAIFTIVLTGSTIGLYRIAKISADAAKRTVEALISSERPYVFLAITEPGVSVLDDGTMRFADVRLKYRLMNHGRGVAMLHELKREFPVVEDLTNPPPPIDPNIDRGTPLPAGAVSAHKLPYPQEVSLFLSLAAEDGARLREQGAWNTRRLFFQGYVRFSDTFGIHYITGFMFAFFPTGGNWALRGGDQYNYTRVEDVTDIPPHPDTVK